MAARKHHYVPQFYQKGFADVDGLLWVYDRKIHTYKKLHPTVICRSEDLYTIGHAHGPRDRRVETEILSPIESAAAPVIRKLRPGVVPNPMEYAQLVFFIAVQY